MSFAFWESQGFAVGHQQMTMFRDPVAGKSFGGALSSDCEEDELPYKPWRRRCSEESSRVESSPSSIGPRQSQQ